MAATDNYTPSSEIDKVYKELADSFSSGKTKSIDFRKKQLLKLAYLFRDNMDCIVAAIHEDLGKPKQEVIAADVAPMIGDALWAYEHIDTWIQPEPVEEHPREKVFNPILIKEPKGLGLIITAYNYPGFTARAIPGIIASGCAMVWKPSEHIPKTNAILSQLFSKYLDPTLYRIVQGAIPETVQLLSHRWGQIIFVGSLKGGMACAVAAAKTLSPITLELGGRNPCFVHSSATMDIAARSILWGKFFNAGQTCVCPNYIVVLEKDKEALITALLEAYRKLYSVNQKNTISPLNVVGQYERIERLLKETKGKIIAGGETSAKERYVAPTIVVDVGYDDALMREEIFGPILPIIAVTSLDVALEEIKQYDEPLAAFLYHNDVQVADYVREHVSSGTWVENESLNAHFAVTVPLCGRGSSGMGRGYKGRTSFLEFTHLRPCCRAPESLKSEPFIQIHYPPYTEETLANTIRLSVPEIKIPRPEGI